MTLLEAGMDQAGDHGPTRCR